MTDEARNLYAQAKSVFEKILDQVEVECGGNAALQQDVLSLLRYAQDDPDTTLDFPAPAAHHPVHALDDYELLDELGKGGMGVVYRARQLSLDRIVAVKMIRDDRALNPNDLVREAKTAAGLHHPNIVAVHGFGSSENFFFFSMEFVDGASLKKIRDDSDVPVATAVRWTQRVAEALAYAHEHGVCHRDVTPSNILIDSKTGEPRITDFGLAFSMDDELQMASRVSRGTPGYLPPEVAKALRDGGDAASWDVDWRRAEVYALGATLFFLLTKQAPHVGTSPQEVLELTAGGQPADCALLENVHKDLAAICRKSLATKALDRYASMKEFSADLVRFTENRPTQARPLSLPFRAWKSVCRNLVRTVLLVMTALALAVGTAASSWFYWQAVARRAEADYGQQKLEFQLLIADRANYAAQMRFIQEEWKESRSSSASQVLETISERSQAPRSFEWAYWQQLLHQSLLRVHHPRCAAAVFVGRDGGLATVGESLVIWDSDLLQQRHRAPGLGVKQAVTNANRDRLLMLADDNTAMVWSVADQMEIASFQAPQRTLAIALSDTGEWAAMGGSEGDIVVVDVAAPGDAPPKLQLSEKGVHSLAFGKANELAVGTDDGQILLYGPDGKSLAKFAGHQRAVSGLVFTEEKLISGSFDGTVREWTLDSPQDSRVVATLANSISAIAIHIKRGELAVATLDRELSIWSLSSTQRLGDYYGHEAPLDTIDWDEKRNRIVGSTVEGKVLVWDASRPQLRQELTSTTPFASIAFVPGTRRVVLCRGNSANPANHGEVLSWDPHAERTVTIEDIGNYMTAVGTSRKYIAASNGQGRLRLWTHDGGTFWDAEGRLPHVKVLRFAEPNYLIAIGGNQFNDKNPGFVKLYDCQTHRLVAERDFATYAYSGAVDHSSRRLAVGMSDGRIKLLDIPSLDEIAELDGHTSRVTGLDFSRTQKKLVSSGWDKNVIVWDLDSKTQHRRLPQHFDVVTCVAFSPDGERIATGTGNPYVRKTGDVELWDAETGQLVLQLVAGNIYFPAITSRGNTFMPWSNTVVDLAFSDDGAAFAVGYADGTVAYWDVGQAVGAARANGSP